MPNPDYNNPPDLTEESRENFEKRLADSLYGNLDWSEEDKDFLRESGLI